MRELVLDTETTGLDHEGGDRIVEVGIVELNNYIITGKYLHYYINPEKKSDPRAERIHGLTTEFLSNKPKFVDIAETLIDFIGDNKVIIHNAPFDLGFLNAEFSRCNLKELKDEQVIDTLIISRKKYPGQSVSLDALCRRFNIDLTTRDKHGALLDAKLLSQVYLELMGGNQTSLEFNNSVFNDLIDKKIILKDLHNRYLGNEIRPINNIKLDQQDYNKHKDFIKNLPNNIWSKIIN
ncbi:DNA polymerase III subunit epsilon [Alphaproteobacteria bacterium]|nr:DNA polymerase III subunit epsilon [Alphaproteobacteria bacterium]